MGFPNRIQRSSIGPKTLVDVRSVKDETKEISARAFMLTFWQVAGMNMTAARGLLRMKRSGSSYTTESQGLAFDPDQLLPKITWTRNSAGLYTWSFPNTTYEDEQGNAITLSLEGAVPALQCKLEGNINGFATNIKLSDRSGRIECVTHTGVATDIIDGGELLVWLV